jgi:hypothetical protein
MHRGCFKVFTLPRDTYRVYPNARSRDKVCQSIYIAYLHHEEISHLKIQRNEQGV